MDCRFLNCIDHHTKIILNLKMQMYALFSKYLLKVCYVIRTLFDGQNSMMTRTSHCLPVWLYEASNLRKERCYQIIPQINECNRKGRSLLLGRYKTWGLSYQRGFWEEMTFELRSEAWGRLQRAGVIEEDCHLSCASKITLMKSCSISNFELIELWKYYLCLKSIACKNHGHIQNKIWRLLIYK